MAAGAGTWSLPAPVPLQSSLGTLATIKSLVVGLNSYLGVSLSFSVDAGTADTPITFTSAVVNFSPGDPLAEASAGVTLTDNDGNEPR